MVSLKKDGSSGHYRGSKSVTVITEKTSGGKVGSYAVRSVDTGRFNEAKRLAGSVLTQKSPKR